MQAVIAQPGAKPNQRNGDADPTAASAAAAARAAAAIGAAQGMRYYANTASL